LGEQQDIGLKDWVDTIIITTNFSRASRQFEGIIERNILTVEKDSFWAL
jgi:hypothetical protein